MVIDRCACGRQVFCEQDHLGNWLVLCRRCELRCMAADRDTVIARWNHDMRVTPKEKFYPLGPCVICRKTNSRIHIYPLDPSRMVAHCGCGAEIVG